MAADFAGGTGGGALSPDLGREEATMGFVTGGDALSPDQTGGRGEDVEGGGSPAQIVVGGSCEMGPSQAAAGGLGFGLAGGGKERATGHPSEGGLAFDTAGWGGGGGGVQD